MAASILAMFSFLYKENPFYRVAEHVFVGSTAGHALGMAIGNIHRFGWRPFFEQSKYSLLIPLVLGIMLYARFIPKINWVSRWPIAFLVGVGVGQSIYTSLRTQVINQTLGAMIKIQGATLMQTVNNLIGILGLIAVLTYFIFSIQQKGVVRRVAHGGRWLMMVTFGVSFGNVVAGRISVLLGQLQNLLGTWLGII
jgi:hypothetical protein